MRLPLLISLFLFITQIAIGQYVITASDMPEDGDSSRYSSINPLSNIDFESSGPNYTWDFSDITPVNQGLYEYQNVINISLAYLPTFGPNAFGRKILEEINFGVIGINDIYSFYEKNTFEFKSTGRGINIGGVPLGTKHTDSEMIYELPLSYRNTMTDSFELEFPDVGIGVLYSVSGVREYEVDGWGTVITPYDSFQCIRVKATITENDELILSGFPIRLTRIRTEYTWLSKGEIAPVFEVSTQQFPFVGFAPVYIRYRDIYRKCLNIRPQVDFTANDTLIRQGETVSFENNSTCGTGPRNWSITPSAGVNFVNNTDPGTTEPEVRFDNPGLYTINLTETNTQGQNNLRREDYIEVLNTTSVSNNDKGIFNIYPNPAKNQLHINAQSSFEQLRIFDLSGKILFQEISTPGNNKSIDISGLNAGHYFIEVDGHSVKKFIVLP
ncbi:MAG: T9SS type A sorting domain-containing protein [Chitinophagales bacterium]